MLLDPLVSTIEHLQQRIQMHDASLRENETRTRMALIDPLLSALGWDTSDPGLVLPEYSSDSSSGRADYALLRPDGRPAAFIEAKKLGEPLVQHRMQMLNYSNAAGVAYAGLTDGNHWEIYSVFEPLPINRRLLLETALLDNDSYRCALAFLLLWRPNIASSSPDQPESPVLSPLQSDSPQEQAVSNNGGKNDSAAAVVVFEPGWTPLSQVNPAPGDPPPIAIRIHGAPVVTISSWVRVLIETTEWLCQQNRLTVNDCPIETGKTRNLVATTPVHRNGGRFKHAYLTSNGLHLEVNFNGRSCVEYSRRLLARFGSQIEGVALRF